MRNFNQKIGRTVVGTIGTAVFAGLCLVGATAPAVAAPAAATAIVAPR